MTETVGRLAQAGRFLVLARRRADWIARVVGPVDIWQAEGLVALPIALELRRRLGGRVVYDARDLVASAGFARLPGPWLGALLRRERAWARAADAVVTVNEPLARELEARIGRPPA
ncbi:MAG TPA: hypothetical protein VNJ28_01670, partial [Candidatus Limnocylindrales bacterium]|nr:hypothetical protein [Candidatus Limnocylindrales bacterium]